MYTHVDNFRIVAQDPMKWLKLIQQKFFIKEFGPLDYYLGNDYCYVPSNPRWKIGCQTHTKEAIDCMERIYRTILCQKSPSLQGSNPEMDKSNLLNNVGHQQCQTLIGMTQWIVTIGCFDVTFAVSSLSYFGSAPQETYRKLALHPFGYLKKYQWKALSINSRLLIKASHKLEPLTPDFSDDYPHVKEDVDP